MLGIVRAPTFDQYPELRSTPEAQLFDGYRPAEIRTEPCACGGVLVQHVGEDVPTVVERHNRTPGHRAWSARERWA